MVYNNRAYCYHIRGIDENSVFRSRDLVNGITNRSHNCEEFDAIHGNMSRISLADNMSRFVDRNGLHFREKTQRQDENPANNWREKEPS